MSMFSTRKRPEVEGAAAKLSLAKAPRYSGWGVGLSRLAPVDFAPPVDIWSRESAMAVPTISRARDLICTAVGALPLTQWTIDFSEPVPVETRVPPALWMIRPDPNRTRQWLLSYTVDDLFFNGRSYWHVTSRYANSFPATFEWMPSAEVSIDSASGKVTWNAKPIDPADVIEFLSPVEGLLYCGYQAIQTAKNLDAAAERFSLAEIPAGWLSQRPDSEPLDATELAEIAGQFQLARNQRTVAALNPFLEWHESTIDPSKLQLVEARQYQSLELARLANVPAYLVSAPVSSGMTYQNAVQARGDLIDFGAMPFIGCIEQTLSGDNVLPRNSFVRLDLNTWLRNPLTPNSNASPNDAQIAFNDQPNAPAPAANTPPPPPGQVGRPRQADGLNESGTPE